MKIAVIDNGLYVSQAEALSDGGKNDVVYCKPWAKPFPTIEDWSVGHGYGNLKKEIYFFDHILDSDLIVNFDVSQNDLIHYLRQVHPEKSIFGSGMGERLEHDRVAFKKWLEHFNLPVGPYKVITGITNLREYLKKNPNKFIKTNIFRHDMESFFFGKWDDDKYILDEKAVILGMLAETYQFVVEEPIESVCELGYDGFFTGGEYIPFAYGVEMAKNLYVGKVIDAIDELPACMENTLEKFRGLLTTMDYRGALSTEERLISLEESYFIDFCARIPAPLGQIYPVAIKNWTDLVYSIGKKKPVAVDCEFEYVGAFAISAEHAVDHSLKILVEKQHLDAVRFQTISQNKDGYFAVKGNTSVCVLVAGGKSPVEVLERIKEAKDYVEAYSLEKDPVDGIQEQFNEALKGMQSIGLKF